MSRRLEPQSLASGWNPCHGLQFAFELRDCPCRGDTALGDELRAISRVGGWCCDHDGDVRRGGLERHVGSELAVQEVGWLKLFKR